MPKGEGLKCSEAELFHSETYVKSKVTVSFQINSLWINNGVKLYRDTR